MTLDRFLIVGVKTAEREWFALSSRDPSLVEAGLEPIGRPEAELRSQLRYLGLSDADIDQRFQRAREWMVNVAPDAAN